jgi:hypothetical protein
LIAANATFALKAGLWFRRDRLLILSPALGILGRRQADSPLSILSKFPEPPLLFAPGIPSHSPEAGFS